jgi:2-polyprenyl-3-methyl-5-hydroxy-6-metoxy-1,4-benzoquinol methylase
MWFARHDIVWDEDKISRFWDYCQANEEHRRKYFGLNKGRHVAHFLNCHIGFSTVNRIIDISCGHGDILHACFPYVGKRHELYGAEYSQVSVESINGRFKQFPFYKGTRLLRSFPAPFEENFFDLIILTEVVEHLSETQLHEMITECHRLLKTGGYLFISTPNNETLAASHVMCPECGCEFHRWQHVRAFTRESLHTFMTAHCFHTHTLKTLTWMNAVPKRVVYSIAARFGMCAPGGLAYIGVKKNRGAIDDITGRC